MAQYTGNATFTKNSVTVTGVDTTFLSSVTVGDCIMVVEEGVPYTVASIINDLSLCLSAPYAGETIVDTFVVARDITYFRKYLEVCDGDKDWRKTLSETIRKIDADMEGFSGPFPYMTKSAKNSPLTFTECQGYVVYVDTDDVVLRLPPVSQFRNGAGVTVYAVGAVHVYVRPEPADRIRLNGINLDVEDCIVSDGTSGRHIFLVKDSGDGWTGMFNTAGWSDGGHISTTSSTTTTSSSSTAP